MSTIEVFDRPRQGLRPNAVRPQNVRLMVQANQVVFQGLLLGQGVFPPGRRRPVFDRRLKGRFQVFDVGLDPRHHDGFRVQVGRHRCPLRRQSRLRVGRVRVGFLGFPPFLKLGPVIGDRPFDFLHRPGLFADQGRRRFRRRFRRPDYGAPALGAGEIGHTTVQARGRLCTCGGRGCWETLIAARGLLHDTLPDEAEAMHERLLGYEKQFLTSLEVPFRVIDVAAGDLGLSAARKFDCTVKLLSICERITGPDGAESVSARVYPALIPLSHPLATVNGAYNAVVVEAEHLCMRMRGVEKQNSRTITSRSSPTASAESWVESVRM